MSVTSEHVHDLVADLDLLEQSLQYRGKDDPAPVVVREAYTTLSALDDERTRLLATIDALNIELAATKDRITGVVSDVLAAWMIETSEGLPVDHRDALIAHAMDVVLGKASGR
jgi:hypothetical protein